MKSEETTKPSNPICGHATWCICNGQAPSPDQAKQAAENMGINSKTRHMVSGFAREIADQVSYIKTNPRDLIIYRNFQENALEYVSFLLKHSFPGLGVPQGSPQDRSEAEPECGPAGTATPKESVISVEALEKEGWEINRTASNSETTADKGDVCVEFYPGGMGVHITNDQGYISCARGVSSMQDLRQLEVLVNGK